MKTLIDPYYYKLVAKYKQKAETEDAHRVYFTQKARAERDCIKRDYYFKKAIEANDKACKAADKAMMGLVFYNNLQNSLN